MKLEILKEGLTFGLNIVSRITTRNPNLPILEGVLLEAEKNFLSLTTTDLEVGTKWWVLAKISKPGKVVVPARILSDLVKLVDDSKIQLESNQKSLIIKYQNGENQIQGLELEDFPPFPQIEEKTTLLVDSFKFCQGRRFIFCNYTGSKVQVHGSQFKANRFATFFIFSQRYRIRSGFLCNGALRTVIAG